MTPVRLAALLALLTAFAGCGRAGPPVRTLRGQPAPAPAAADSPACEGESPPGTADGEGEEKPK